MVGEGGMKGKEGRAGEGGTERTGEAGRWRKGGREEERMESKRGRVEREMEMLAAEGKLQK